MGESSQNENLIMIEDENKSNGNEMNTKENVEKSKIRNVQIENNRIKQNEEQRMNFFSQIACSKKNLERS
jgi:hypothetical protein